MFQNDSDRLSSFKTHYCTSYSNAPPEYNSCTYASRRKLRIIIAALLSGYPTSATDLTRDPDFKLHDRTPIRKN